jgi:hypothetical protein
MAPPRLGPTQLRNHMLTTLAAEQHGLLSRSQAAAMRLDRSAINRRLASGAWKRVHPSVYSVNGAPSSEAQDVKAVELWAGSDSAISHRSALRLWGFPSQADFIEVSSMHRRSAPEGARHHYTRSLSAKHRTVLNGIVVTTPERTLVDLAALLQSLPAELHSLIDAFFLRELVTPAGLDSFLKSAEARRIPGCHVLRLALRQRRRRAPRTMNELEALVGKVFTRNRHASPVRAKAEDEPAPELRLSFPEKRLILELAAPGLHVDPALSAHRRGELRAKGVELHRSQIRRAALDSSPRGAAGASNVQRARGRSSHACASVSPARL